MMKLNQQSILTHKIWPMYWIRCNHFPNTVMSNVVLRSMSFKDYHQRICVRQNYVTFVSSFYMPYTSVESTTNDYIINFRKCFELLCRHNYEESMHLRLYIRLYYTKSYSASLISHSCQWSATEDNICWIVQSSRNKSENRRNRMVSTKTTIHNLVVYFLKQIILYERPILMLMKNMINTN